MIATLFFVRNFACARNDEVQVYGVDLLSRGQTIVVELHDHYT